jgi:hypothetical protein
MMRRVRSTRRLVMNSTQRHWAQTTERRPRRKLALGVVLLATVAASTPTYAQTSAGSERVVLIAPEIERHQHAELVRGLGAVGVRAATVEEAKLDPTLAACTMMSCVADAARAANGRAAFARITRGGDGKPSLLWALLAADGGEAQARVRIGEGGLAAAVRSAWTQTSLALVLRGDSMIRLETVPSGAVVWLDGVQLGTTPFAQRVAPGEHRIVTKLEGFVSQARVLRSQPGRALLVQMRLARAPSFAAQGGGQPTPRSGARDPARSPWNYILGGTLALLGAPALISSVNALANDGECVVYRDRAAGLCGDRGRFGTRSVFVLALGVVALATGGTVLAVQPIEAGAPARDLGMALPGVAF